MSHLIWPLAIASSFLGFLWVQHLGWNDQRQLVVPTLSISALLVIEQLFPGGRRRRALRPVPMLKDIAHNMIGSLGGPLGDLLFLGAAAWLAGRISDAWGANLWPTHWPWALQAFVLVFVADGLECLRHRWSHTQPLLWRLHSLHHSLHELDVLKSGRGHVLDYATRGLFVFAPLAALGAPAELFWWYPAAVTIFGPVAHSNLELRVPALAHYLVLTPQLHRLHHARALGLAQSNFAEVFPVWDMLLGSYRHPGEWGEPDVGIENDPIPESFLGQLLAPFSWSRLVRDTQT